MGPRKKYRSVSTGPALRPMFLLQSYRISNGLPIAPVPSYLLPTALLFGCGGHTTVRGIHSEIPSHPLPQGAFALELLFALSASIEGLLESNHATRSDFA